jgi:hypothetical protein
MSAAPRPFLVLLLTATCAAPFVFPTVVRADLPGSIGNYIWNTGSPPPGGNTVQAASINIQGTFATTQTVTALWGAQLCGPDSYYGVGIGVWPMDPTAMLHLVGSAPRSNVIFEIAGGVGIGTTTPTAKLDVAGSAKVSENVIVGAQGYSVLPLEGTGPPSGSPALGQVYIDTLQKDAWIYLGDGCWKMITTGACKPSGVMDDEAHPASSMLEAVGNPTHSVSTVRCSMANGGRATIEIFDTGGRRVAILIDGVMASGQHDIQWDGRSSYGTQVPSGVYYARLTTEGIRQETKIVLAR